MKKIFAFLAISSFAFIACQKEAANIDNKKPSTAVENEIPTEIICEIDQEATKTQYASNSTFGWTYRDRIVMPVVKKSSGTITACDLYSFYATGVSGSASVNFIRSNTNPGEDLETYNPNPSGVEGNWTNMGYLVYPEYDFYNPDTKVGKEHSGDYPVVNLPSTIAFDSTNPLDCPDTHNGIVPMIGRKVGNRYKFATAVGILKVSISNIPANLTSVKLVSTDKCISGKFAVSHSSEKYTGSDVYIAQLANTSEYNSEGNKALTLTTSSLTAGESYDFYFPVPVGSYDANTLSLRLYNGSTVVYKRKISKELSVARNEILGLPTLIATTPGNVGFDRAKPSSGTKMKFTNNTGFTLRFDVSTSPEIVLSHFYENMKFTSANTNANYYTLSSTKSAGNVSSISEPGLYYLHFVFLNTSSTLGIVV